MSDQQEMEEFRNNIKRWEEDTLQSTLDKFPERQENFITASSELINRLYTPADLDGFSFDEEIGYPGLYPFTRGVSSDDVPLPAMDHANVRRLRYCRGDKPAI